jgi:serine/threonine-protein kinase
MTQLLNGRYELGDVIGSGGMGAVYRAFDTRLGRTVAVKALRGGALADELARARMRSEARLASTVHHPGVAQIYDYDDSSTTHGGMAFIVMELVEGRSLAQVLREEGRLPVDQVMSVVQQVADALAAAHAAGVVHRDLKPANIMLTDAGRAVLVDFGIASSAGSEPLTETGALIGTADYLSPEQAAGRAASPRSDLYSLGVVAYQCLTGTSPFRREHHVATALAHLQDDLPPLGESVPQDVRELVGDLAEKNPVDRPTAAAEVARRAALVGAARTVDVARTATPTQSFAAPRPPRAPQASSRPRRVLVLGSGAALTAAAAVLVVGMSQRSSDTPPAAASSTSAAPVDQVVAPSTVTVSADDVIGRPADEATATLRQLGLEVARHDVASSATPGLVLGLDRTGQVPQGTTITLDVAVSPAAPSPSPSAPSSDTTTPVTVTTDGDAAPVAPAARDQAPGRARKNDKAPAAATSKGKPSTTGNGKGGGKNKDR